MSFRFYTNAISQASRTAAMGLFIVGLVLVGFGCMIYLLPRLFATLAAVIFFAAGLGCGITAAKIYLAQRHLDRINFNNSQGGGDSARSGGRKNVSIHIEEHYDM